MKTLRIFPLLAVLIAITNLSFAQTKSETIPVSGNCGMCKNNIEKAAKKAGVEKADWDMDKKILSVVYTASSTNAEKIQKSIAAAGYDTRDIRGDDNAYDKLHACCKYERTTGTKMTCCDKEKCKSEGDCGMDCCKDSKCLMDKKAEKKSPHQDHSATPAMECCKNSCSKS